MATGQLNKKYLSPHCLRREWGERKGADGIAAIFGTILGLIGTGLILFACYIS